MLDCISVENMRLSDQYPIQNFVSGTQLMGRAAQGVFQAVDWKGSAAIMAGSGNNGGDGFALACILQAQGIPCTVFTLSDRMSEDSRYYAEKAAAAGVPVRPFVPGENQLRGWDVVVDCLLGTGFHGGLRDSYRSAIQEINAADAFVVSVDINSGMNGDTGDYELAVRSHLTVTIGYVKRGLVTAHAGDCMERLVCADIGIRLCREEDKLCTPQEWAELCTRLGLPRESRRAEADGAVYLPCPPWLEPTILSALTAEI